MVSVFVQNGLLIAILISVIIFVFCMDVQGPIFSWKIILLLFLVLAVLGTAFVYNMGFVKKDTIQEMTPKVKKIINEEKLKKNERLVSIDVDPKMFMDLYNADSAVEVSYLVKNMETRKTHIVYKEEFTNYDYTSLMKKIKIKNKLSR